MLIEEILRQVLENRDSAFFYTPPFYSDSSSYYFRNPHKIITAKNLEEIFNALNEIDSEINSGKQGYGFISYEAGYAFEKKLNSLLTNNDEELLRFCFYDEGEFTKINSGELEFTFKENEKCNISFLHLTKTPDEFRKNILEIKNSIAEGDTYQVNYTIKAKFNFHDDPADLFKNLVFNQSSQYCAFINNGKEIIISISPELFFSIKNNEITVRPMKGTIKRGINLKEDSLHKEELENSIKDRAENLMIVDLLRNDIGKLSEYGTVDVKKIFDVEKYESLFQMVTSIKSKLKAGIKFSDVVKNIYPCGSITGAPKIRTMQIINKLEEERRRLYTGAIGLIKKDEMIFNVAIRTITLDRQSKTGELGIGSGIVWDSDPGKEYEETLLKSRFLTNPNKYFELIETMRLKNGKIFLLNEHLLRLKRSADYFLFQFNENKIDDEIKRSMENLDADKKYLLRLLLNKWGKIKIEVKGFPLMPDEISIIISKEKIDSGNLFQYFKTTNRKLYDEEFKYYSAKEFFDVIFFNERDELAEGAITNIFLRKNGIWYTPPIEAGILNGVYRDYFITVKRKAKEKILYRNDLTEADEILLTNSVRGEIKVNRLFLDESTVKNL